MPVKNIALIAFSCLLFFSSCITSLHQLVTYDKVTADNRIIGTWQQDNNTRVKIENLAESDFAKSISKAKVGEKEVNMGFDSKEDSILYSKSYLFSIAKEDYTYYMAASLIKLGNEIYADILPAGIMPLMPARSKDINDLFGGIDYIPSHTIAKIIITENSIQVKFINGEFIKQQLSIGAIAVKYEKDDLFNTTLITASTKDLREFLIKYGNDERLYSTANTITLKKI